MDVKDKRAIRIVELAEQLEEAKKIISRLLWPCDTTLEEQKCFERRAADFVGNCNVFKLSHDTCTANCEQDIDSTVAHSCTNPAKPVSIHLA